jgi:hypothetical protein
MNATINPTLRKRSEKSKSILSKIIVSNYALSAFFSGWQEERYLSRAISLTCFQIFAVVVSLFLVINPKLKTNEDLYFLYGEVATMAFLLLVYFRYVVTRYIKNQRILAEINLTEKDNKVKIISSLLFSLVCFAVFFISCIVEGYQYHTRFFWWNH